MTDDIDTLRKVVEAQRKLIDEQQREIKSLHEQMNKMIMEKVWHEENRKDW